VEVDFSGFLLLGLDQLVNNGAKARYLSNGQVRISLVVRVGQGPLGSFGAQHSQVQHAWLASVPGLAVCAPYSVQDAYDLMRWALRQSDPVVFAEDMRLYRTRGSLVRHDEPIEPSARVARPGRDATVVAFGFGVTRALSAADALAADGIEVEILDVPMLAPLVGRQVIAASLTKTGLALCIADDSLLGGITATLATVVEEEARGTLRAPVLRLGARHAPAPYNRQLEEQIYPSAASLENSLRLLIGSAEA
jgi:pyruvate dehydrogenase E1 component beta subunit